MHKVYSSPKYESRILDCEIASECILFKVWMKIFGQRCSVPAGRCLDLYYTERRCKRHNLLDQPLLIVTSFTVIKLLNQEVF